MVVSVPIALFDPSVVIVVESVDVVLLSVPELHPTKPNAIAAQINNFFMLNILF